jgi:hypothetical protein
MYLGDMVGLLCCRSRYFIGIFLSIAGRFHHRYPPVSASAPNRVPCKAHQLRTTPIVAPIPELEVLNVYIAVMDMDDVSARVGTLLVAQIHTGWLRSQSRIVTWHSELQQRRDSEREERCRDRREFMFVA